MSNEVTRIIQMRSLSNRTVANGVSNHERIANEAAKDKNNDK